MKHKKRQTKGIALLLSFVMLFSALCIPSFASETETEKDNSNNLVIGQNEKTQQETSLLLLEGSEAKAADQITVTYQWKAGDHPSIFPNDVTLPDPETIEKGSAYTAKYVTSATNIFDGWYLDEGYTQKFVDGTKLEYDTTLYANWRAKNDDGELLWWNDVYTQKSDGTYPNGPVLYGQGGWASPDSPISISADDFNGEEVSGGRILGKDMIHDAGYEKERLSADRAIDAGKHNPLRIYYKYPCTVTYEYEGDVPVGAPELPKALYTTYRKTINVAQAPTMDGYTFSGWTVKSPTGIDITDGTFIMPQAPEDETPEYNIVLSGTWTKAPDKEVTWYKAAYIQNLDGTYGRALYGQGGWASPDSLVEISADDFDSQEVWELILGDHVIFDENHPDNRLSATAGEAGPDNPLKIYYKLPYTVTYEYEGDVPDGAPKLPETSYATYIDEITVEPAPTMDGYTFSGWEVKSPTGIDITDGTFQMPKDNVVLSGKWDKASTPVDPKAAVYKVEHYKQTDSNSYTLSDTDFPLYGEIGKTVTATPKDYEGYSVNQEKSIMSGTVIKPVEENGEVKYLVLEVYYDKDQTPTLPDPENPDPDKPDRPNRPDPDDPDRPNRPDPDRPSRPDSDKSDKPNKPESSQPSAPDREEVDSNRKPQQNNQTEQKPNPETGDSTSLALCLGLLAISSVGMIAAMPKRKK